MLRCGNDVWVPLTYAGMHATEKVLRRREQHPLWDVDSFSQGGCHLCIGNRLF